MRLFKLLQCFARCSSSIRIEIGRANAKRAIDALQLVVDRCDEREAFTEGCLIQTQQEIRTIAIHLETDQFPDILMYRMKSLINQKKMDERTLVAISSRSNQIKAEIQTLRDSELNSETLQALKGVLASMPDPSSQSAEETIDAILEERERTAETTQILSESLDLDEDEKPDENIGQDAKALLQLPRAPSAAYNTLTRRESYAVC